MNNLSAFAAHAYTSPGTCAPRITRFSHNIDAAPQAPNNNAGPHRGRIYRLENEILLRELLTITVDRIDYILPSPDYRPNDWNAHDQQRH